MTAPSARPVSAARLRFSGPTLAGIFGGRITGWSDQAIAAENPGILFPDAPITRCVREDSSGTSAVFTGFLSEVDAEFRSTVGVSRLPEWPGQRVVRFPGNERSRRAGSRRSRRRTTAPVGAPVRSRALGELSRVRSQAGACGDE